MEITPASVPEANLPLTATEDVQVSQEVEMAKQSFRRAQEKEKNETASKRKPPGPHKRRHEWPHWAPRKAFRLKLEHPEWSMK